MDLVVLNLLLEVAREMAKVRLLGHLSHHFWGSLWFSKLFLEFGECGFAVSFEQVSLIKERHLKFFVKFYVLNLNDL